MQKPWPKPWSRSSQRREWARARVWVCPWCSAWRNNPVVPCASKALPQAEQPPDFGFPLPRSDAAFRTHAEHRHSSLGPSKDLFVDDDLLIAGSTVDLLEDLGHEVIEVHSAIEALRLLEDGLAADLLITDHAMPGMTGIELAREVRRQYPQLPILLATGFAELEGGKVVDVARLAKPYTQAQLATEIARLLPDGEGWLLRCSDGRIIDPSTGQRGENK